MDSEMRKYLDGVTGALEATRCEELYVYDACKRTSREFKSTGSGFLETVGHLDKAKKKPVVISILTITIDGQKLLVYHATSRFVDHDMIRTWLEKNLPTTAFEDNDPRKRLNHTDATNWSNVLHPHAAIAA